MRSTARCGPGAGRKRRRRNGDDGPQLQGGYRYGVASRRRVSQALPRRRARAGQPRDPSRVHSLGRARRAGDHRPAARVPGQNAKAAGRPGARSSSSSPPTRPLLPHQLSAWPNESPWGSGAWAARARMAAVTSSSRFRRETRGAWNRKETKTVEMISNDAIDPLFYATVQATEEAILNAMVAAETMTGRMASPSMPCRTIACGKCSASTTGSRRGPGSPRRNQPGKAHSAQVGLGERSGHAQRNRVIRRGLVVLCPVG